ncbi:short chain alcohol dehydrogenase [Lineolata rhizophorae]|uniref:Short chain alcohol dehydrogenase n=1 Tax=Lineolata rhizophorae TaxID=578093 RepID=A0A6A6NR26_9PEZI|nr:short chain alcohol dehydrogenase [Lineolata rhizophorae]
MADRQQPRSVLISGGARGIGRALARRFCERGDNVYILDIDEAELKHTAHAHLQPHWLAGRLAWSTCDLRSVGEIRKKVRAAAEGTLRGRIDVLVNNGGISAPRWKDGRTMADEETFDEWQAYIETNLTAPFAVSQASLPYMRVEPGSADAEHTSTSGPCIVHVASFRAHRSDPNQEGYAASKTGQLGLMHSMAMSLSEVGIRVNTVSPGRVKVMHESKEGDEKGVEWASLNEEKDVQDHPSNRAGMPDDVVDAVEYLVNAGFVTGQELVVDGGASKKK